MGQYYCGLIIHPDRSISSISSYDFNAGSKLTEHSWIGNFFVNVAYLLILNRRRKVAWIGDYSEEPYNPDEDAYARVMDEDAFKSYYDTVWKSATSRVPENAFSSYTLKTIFGFKTKGMYLVNHSKKVFLPLELYIQENSKIDEYERWWCMNPLPLLTACGNGRGGGDYRNESCIDSIGTWAFDLLEYTPEIPPDFTSVMFHFND